MARSIPLGANDSFGRGSSLTLPARSLVQAARFAPPEQQGMAGLRRFFAGMSRSSVEISSATPKRTAISAESLSAAFSIAETIAGGESAGQRAHVSTVETSGCRRIEALLRRRDFWSVFIGIHALRKQHAKALDAHRHQLICQHSRGLVACLVEVVAKAVMIGVGMGKKDRFIPMSERALRWTDKYVAEARPALLTASDEGTVFLEHGVAFERLRLTTLVRSYIGKAKIGKTGGCHLFRRTVATLMLENGADIRAIQELPGHAKLSITELYTRVSIILLRQVYPATHPGASEKRAEEAAELPAQPDDEDDEES